MRTRHRKVYCGLRSHTLEELTEFWKPWSEYDHSCDQAVTWADFKSNVAVKEVAALATSGSWKIFEAALMLMK